jgi:hypothetical protein
MKVVEETVGYRERNNVTRNDFMQLLIQLKNQGYLETDNQDNEKVQSEYQLDNRLDILIIWLHTSYYFQISFVFIFTLK